MALVKVLDKYDLQREFANCDRDYFSLDGYQALLDLFEDCDCGKNTDLDVVAICGEFSEDEPSYFIEQYSHLSEFENIVDDDGEIDNDALMDALNYYTFAVMLDNGNILIQDF